MDALARRADRIVLGRIDRDRQRRHASGAAGPGGNAVPIRIERTLKGASDSPWVVVDTVAPYRGHDDSAHVWFLHRGPGGTYEPLELRGGLFEVSGARIPRLGLALDEAIARIERAASARREVSR
jgi:hypothetical protein